MSDFARAFPIMFWNENGGPVIVSSFNAKDPGGYSRGGVALNMHPGITRADLDGWTFDDFKAFYAKNYWLPQFDELPWPVNLVVFDGKVNQGVNGIRALQRALAVAADGVIGQITIGAAVHWNPLELALETLWQRELLYRQNADFSTFSHGWIKRLYRTIYRAGLPAS